MNAKRLLKLADFLDKLPRAKFDFGVIAQQDGKPMLEALKAGKERCGTVACAIGWMPAVFPRALHWNEWQEVELRGTYLNIDAAKIWFDISTEDVQKLFVPGASYSGLPETATPKRVARHIRKWVAARSRTKKAA